MRPPMTAETLPPKCPPLIREFLSLHHYNYHLAAKALGIGGSTVGGWARGEKSPSGPNQARMHEFIDRHKKGTTPLSEETPQNKPAPADLVALVHAVGNPLRAIALIDVAPEEFFAAYDSGEMPDDMQKAVSAALRSDERIAKARKKKGLPRESVMPPLIAELLTKHHGSMAEASNALGYKSSSWMMKFANPKEDFGSEAQERVRAAIEEKPMKFTNGLDLDRGDLSLAIVFCDADKLGAVIDAGEAMGGRWVFRKRTGARWLVILRLGGRELQAFKSVVRLVAEEVITP